MILIFTKPARCFKKWESYASTLKKRQGIFFTVEYCLLIAKEPFGFLRDAKYDLSEQKT